jgi:hypothetical protein
LAPSPAKRAGECGIPVGEVNGNAGGGHVGCSFRVD